MRKINSAILKVLYVIEVLFLCSCIVMNIWHTEKIEMWKCLGTFTATFLTTLFLMFSNEDVKTIIEREDN